MGQIGLFRDLILILSFPPIQKADSEQVVATSKSSLIWFVVNELHKKEEHCCSSPHELF
jgi:hypothetical protein